MNYLYIISIDMKILVLHNLLIQSEYQMIIRLYLLLMVYRILETILMLEAQI